MREFDSLGQFAAFLAGQARELAGAERRGLEEAGRIIADEAKGLIGSYQEGSPPFRAWAELADATKADRVRRGYSENDPLLRTGELRASIGHRVIGHTAHIGTDDPVAEFLEYGTEKMPPRSFLGLAAVRKRDEVGKKIGESVVAVLAGLPPPIMKSNS